jgi:hypothetical protein
MNQITKHQQYAIQAKLNMLLGAEEYDRVFIDFELMEFRWGVLNVRVNSLYVNDIQTRYWLHIAITAESILRQRVRALNILTVDLSDTNAVSPAHGSNLVAGDATMFRY